MRVLRRAPKSRPELEECPNSVVKGRQTMNAMQQYDWRGRPRLHECRPAMEFQISEHQPQRYLHLARAAEVAGREARGGDLVKRAQQS
jgi:hypothetical protein